MPTFPVPDRKEVIRVGLRPLVSKGEDRLLALDALVRRLLANCDHSQYRSFVSTGLLNIADFPFSEEPKLLAQETDDGIEAIDLQELLDAVQRTERPPPQEFMSTVLALRGWHIPKCNVRLCPQALVGLILVDCRFESDVRITSTKFNCSVVVLNCAIPKRLIIRGSEFHDTLTLSGCRISGSVDFRDSTFHEGVVADGVLVTQVDGAATSSVTISQCTFNSSLQCNDFYCQTPVKIENTHLGYGLQGERVTLAQSLHLSGPDMGPALFLNKSCIGGDLRVMLSSDGMILDIRESLIFGDLSLQNCYMSAPTRFDGTRVLGKVVCGTSRFARPGGIGGLLVGTKFAEFIDSDKGTVDFDGKRGRVRFRRIWWPIATLFSWETVRNIGELKALTRASYFQLVLVPILAACWPGVRYTVDRSAEVVSDAANQLRAAAQALEDTVRTSSGWPGASSLSQQVTDIRARAESIARDIDARVPVAPDLPIDLALLFFGALSVAIGHLIYQLAAPQLLKEKSREDLIRERGARYVAAPKEEQNDIVQRSIDQLQAAATKIPERRHPSLVKRHGQAVWVPSTYDDLLKFDELGRADEAARVAAASQPPAATTASKPTPSLTHTPAEIRQILVDEGAAAEYDAEARKSIEFASITSAIYMLAFYLIAWVVANQAGEILRAANIPWYFLPDWRAEILWILVTTYIVTGFIWLWFSWRSRRDRARGRTT